MNVGDVVTVYQDPLTEEKPEGKAKLIKYDGTIGEHNQRWICMWDVEFLKDPGQTFSRQILAPTEYEL